MRNKLIIVGGIAFLAYVLGSRSAQGTRKGRQAETVRQQAERLWKEPRSRKARKAAGKKLGKAARKATKKTVAVARAKRRELEKQLSK